MSCLQGMLLKRHSAGHDVGRAGAGHIHPFIQAFHCHQRLNFATGKSSKPLLAFTGIFFCRETLYQQAHVPNRAAAGHRQSGRVRSKTGCGRYGHCQR